MPEEGILDALFVWCDGALAESRPIGQDVTQLGAVVA